MIYIKESFEDDHSVRIRVDGVLDEESLRLLEDVCKQHLKASRKIRLDANEVLYSTRGGRDFLKEIQNKDIIRVDRQPKSLKATDYKKG